MAAHRHRGRKPAARPGDIVGLDGTTPITRERLWDMTTATLMTFVQARQLREALGRLADRFLRGIGPQDVEQVRGLVLEVRSLMRPRLVRPRPVPGRPDVSEADEWTWPMQGPDSPDDIVAFLRAVHVQLEAVEATLNLLPPSTKGAAAQGHDHVTSAPSPSRADAILERILESQGLSSAADLADFRIAAGLDRQTDGADRAGALDRIRKRRRHRGKRSLGPILDVLERAGRRSGKRG
jgi:hypothetical protein